MKKKLYAVGIKENKQSFFIMLNYGTDIIEEANKYGFKHLYFFESDERAFKEAMKAENERS